VKFLLFDDLSLFSALHVSLLLVFFLLIRRLPIFTLFPYTTLFRSDGLDDGFEEAEAHANSFRNMINELKEISSSEEIKLLDNFRSEEHTSELQSRFDLVCRLLLEKKKKT